MGAGRKLPRRRENALLMEDGSNGRRLVVFAHKTYWNVAAILLPDDSASTSKPEQRLERMPCPGMRKSEKRLSMNRPFVLLLVLVIDSSSWLRGRGRARLGSWSQCAMLESWRLSMNRPFVLLLVLVIDSSSWLRGRGRERLGSWSQCAILESWRLSMNRPFVLVLVLELVLD